MVRLCWLGIIKSWSDVCVVCVCAAFSTFLLAMGVVCGIILRHGPEAFTFIYDRWVGLVTASMLVATIQAVYCYASSFRSGKLLALGGNTGNVIYDVRLSS